MSLITRLDRPMPPQNTDRIVLHAQRFRRAADAQRPWAEKARKCTDYLEGRQWSAEDLAKLATQKRPALVLNKIRPLVNLIVGYHITNRVAEKCMPGLDGQGTAEQSAVMTQVLGQIDDAQEMPYVDSSVFLDGIVAGRGYYRHDMDFEKNLLGEVRVRAQDPFATYLDPDGLEYDLNSGSFMMTTRMVSIEEIEFFYGGAIAAMLGPFLQAGGVSSGMPSSWVGLPDEVTPPRTFSEVTEQFGLNAYADFFHDFLDASRKSIRLLDIEHYVRVKRWFFVDLEAGLTRPVPDEWDMPKIEKVLAWCQEQGQPVAVQQRMTRRLRNTHMIGDVIAYDEWSHFDTMSLTPFFPYFRRGVAQGMVEHLLDAQDEVNKRRSARLNIIGRSSAGGWMYPKGSLDAQQKRNLEMWGSTPGVQVEYDSKGDKLAKPEQLNVQASPMGMAQLEQEAEDDLKQISGINDSTLGMIDQAVVSGAAIERRQRQTIVGQEHLLANFRRTKGMCGRKKIELVQKFYTEERIIRRIGKGSNPVEIAVNQRTAAGIINDLSMGSFALQVDETPLSKTYMEAQFEELQALKAGGMPVPDDFLIDASSIARKEEMKIAVAEQRAAQQAMAMAGAEMTDGGGGGPGGSNTGPDGGSLPAGPEPGGPIV